MFTSIKSLCKISQRKPQRCQTRIWGSLWQKGIENTHSKGSKDYNAPGSPSRVIFFVVELLNFTPS